MTRGVLIKLETAVAVATLMVGGGGLLLLPACPPFVDGIVVHVTQNKWLSFVFV